MADTPIVNSPAPDLSAKPGEDYAAYQARLGATSGTPGSGAGFGTPIPFNPTINSANTQPQNPIPYNPAPTIPPPALPPVNPNPAPAQGPGLSQPEQNVQDKINEILGLNTQDANRATDQNQANGTYGVTDAQAKVNDLTAQSNQILDAQRQIQLTAPQAGQGGNSTALVNGAQAEKLRQNAIQALSVQSLLDVAKGNLSNAQLNANQAVAAKYDPIEAQIKTAQANLDLILKSPEYTNAEKDRAQAQLDLQNKKAADLAQAKTDSATIMSWAAAALANGASTLQAQQIMALAQSDKPDLKAAFALFAPWAKDPQATQKALLDLQTQRANLAKTTADTAKIYADMKNAGAGGLSQQDIANIMGTIGDYNGTKYVTASDLEGLDPKQKSAFILAAKQNGYKTLDSKDASALKTVQGAQADATSFLSFITSAGEGGTSLLPKDQNGQPMQYADVKLNDFLQYNNQLSAFNTWKLSVIPIMSALKGAGSGGGGGAARLFETVADLLPKDTDTLGTAKDKIANVNSLLSNAGDSILGVKSSSSNPISQLQSDISTAASKNDYGTREQLITKLTSLYPELTPSQISSAVYTGIPDKK